MATEGYWPLVPAKYAAEVVGDQCPNCASHSIWFDRSICPCGVMHYYCGDCGLQQDGCAKPKPKPYRVLVTGSRTWNFKAILWNALNDVYFDLAEPRSLIVVHGDCPAGADRLAAEWVEWMIGACYPGITQEPHPADWGKWGKSAGFKRNEEMVMLGADVCLAFLMPCTKGCRGHRQPHYSHGATNCLNKARLAGIPVREFTK